MGHIPGFKIAPMKDTGIVTIRWKVKAKSHMLMVVSILVSGQMDTETDLESTHQRMEEFLTVSGHEAKEYRVKRRLKMETHTLDLSTWIKIK